MNGCALVRSNEWVLTFSRAARCPISGRFRRNRCVVREISLGGGEKNRSFQSDGWGKSADNGAIVCQIFIRILENLHCAKIGGLRVAGIAEVERDGETGFWIVRV